jgi:transposase
MKEDPLGPSVIPRGVMSTELEEVPVRIVGALDVHRSQITFRCQDMETGEVRRGRMAPAAREVVREWLGGFEPVDAHFALEATTGWRFVAEEIERAGLIAHLAEPAETSRARGPKRRAKTDRADCDHMSKLLIEGRLPESWIPPEHILELRTLVRLRKTLVDQRTEWQQRMHAQLFHQGVPPGFKLWSRAGRARLEDVELSPAARRVIETGMRMLDYLDAEIGPLDRDLSSLARRQPGCRALRDKLYGVGFMTAASIVAELGDCRRFTSSDDAVRYAGLDVTVYESNSKRAPGHLSRQGPAVLRWALYEAAQCAARKSSPDYGYYLKVRKRIDHSRACLSVARKLGRRTHHILRELGDAAIAPPAPVSSRSRYRSAA